MLDAWMLWRTRLSTRWAHWRSSRAVRKAIRQANEERSWFVIVLLTLHAVTSYGACAHQHHVTAIADIRRDCDREMRHVASTSPLEGMGARLDAIQLNCDAQIEAEGGR